LAHEGHAPLPSKGAKVDVAKGHVLLTKDARDALDVQSEEVGVQPAPESLLAYASLVSPWDRHAFATSRLSGRIVKLHARPGQHVKAGTLLAEVESQELEMLRLELVNGEVEAKQAAEVHALKRTAERTLPAQDVQEAETRMQQARNAVHIAKGKWLSLGLPEKGLGEVLRLGSKAPKTRMPILSPISGTLIHSDLRVGKVIEPNEHLFEIFDLSRLWVKIDLLEKDLHRVAAGQKVEVRLTAYPNEVFPCTVKLVGLHLDPAPHLNAVWAELNNPKSREPRLLPGMYGEARVESPPSSGTVTEPTAALVNDGVDRFVLVEAAKTAEVSEFLRKSVIVVRESPDAVVLRTGSLFPGDRVVTRGSHELGNFFVPGVLRLSPETKQTLGLKIEPVGFHSLDSTVEVPATVEVPPEGRSTVASPISGALVRVLVERGQQVKAGHSSPRSPAWKCKRSSWNSSRSI
jgi:multidrug efflux pump subunit AcrA (membrane-fusion protein)